MTEKVRVTFYGPEGSTVQGVSKAVADTLHMKEGDRYPALKFVELVMALEMYLALEAMSPCEVGDEIPINSRGGVTSITPAQATAIGGVERGQLVNQGQMLLLAQLRLCQINQRIVDQGESA